MPVDGSPEYAASFLGLVAPKKIKNNNKKIPWCTAAEIFSTALCIISQKTDCKCVELLQLSRTFSQMGNPFVFWYDTAYTDQTLCLNKRNCVTGIFGSVQSYVCYF